MIICIRFVINTRVLSSMCLSICACLLVDLACWLVAVSSLNVLFFVVLSLRAHACLNELLFCS